MKRRDFLKCSLAVGAGLAASPYQPMRLMAKAKRSVMILPNCQRLLPQREGSRISFLL